MLSSIIWTITGIKSRGVFEILKFLPNLYKLLFISIQEPFVANHIDFYKKALGFDSCHTSRNEKIWIFWNSQLNATIFCEDDQQVMPKMNQRGENTTFWMTVIYAKTKRALGLPLWESLKQCNQNINGPWCISGDFNIITEAGEKKGGVPHRMEKSWDFISCIGEYGMVDASFNGPRFTW